jgi:hypothetical protein
MQPLWIKEILRWADAYHNASGVWPNSKSGAIANTAFESWGQVDEALRRGHRGLAGGSSLEQLLAEQRGVRDLSVSEILAWANAYHKQSGRWPNKESGPVHEQQGETWVTVDAALRLGRRGLPGGSSLAALLALVAKKTATRDDMRLPRYTRKQILVWADAHRRRTGCWPTARTGAIPEAPGETWQAVDAALRRGLDRPAGGSSLARFLAEYRGMRDFRDQAPLWIEQILAWADTHYQQTGQWPKRFSGPIPQAPHESWLGVDSALRKGYRGQPGGSSLARLLAQKRAVRKRHHRPWLVQEQILAWAAAHRQRTGKYPTKQSGPVAEAPWETWGTIDCALRTGYRGLPGGSSLARLLREHSPMTEPLTTSTAMQ